VNGEIVYDLKTVHSGAFHYMKDDISESKKPNILQVMYYAKMLNKPKGALVFISKDDLCLKEYTFFLDKWEKAIDVELKMLRAAWLMWLKNETPPPAIPRAYTDSKGKCQECKYCSWATLCGQIESRNKEVV
jgi:hypothetical protein